MSRPRDYFAARPDRVAALATACAAWRGTPFRERSAVPGPLGGVDCVGFVAAVLLVIGAIPAAIAVPPYAVNHAEHSDESVLLAWFAQPAVRARVRPVDEDEPHLDGDFVFPVVGRSEHHLALRIGDDVHMVTRNWGVGAPLRVAQLVLHRARYRLMEEPAP